MTSYSKSHWCLGTLLCSALLVLTSHSIAQSVEEIYAQGQTAYDQADMMGAMRYFREAAELEHAPSQAMLASILDAAEVNTEALKWYQRAAEHGNIQGQLGLATMLVAGEAGEADMEAGLNWFTRAAESGSLDAMRVLEANYRAGDMGLSADTEQADYWLKRAAVAGDRWSQQQLALRQSNATEK